MKLTERILFFLGILALLLLCVHFYFKPPVTIEKIKTEVVHDTITYEVEKVIFKPVASIVDTFYVDSIIYTTDTTKCLETLKNTLYELHAERSYNDTLKNDSIAFVSVFSKVKQNKLTYQKLTYRNNAPTVINTFVDKRNELYYGGGISSTGMVNLGLMYKTKKDVIYGVSYSPTHNTFMGRVYFKIGR
jgi:NADH:ubiquinone oxidoreductase subunit 5 (subunit L)/multisubunit Na+/H+ antiporter MnhA subunit